MARGCSGPASRPGSEPEQAVLRRARGPASDHASRPVRGREASWLKRGPERALLRLSERNSKRKFMFLNLKINIFFINRSHFKIVFNCYRINI